MLDESCNIEDKQLLQHTLNELNASYEKREALSSSYFTQLPRDHTDLPTAQSLVEPVDPTNAESNSNYATSVFTLLTEASCPAKSALVTGLYLPINVPGDEALSAECGREEVGPSYHVAPRRQSESLYLGLRPDQVMRGVTSRQSQPSLYSPVDGPVSACRDDGHQNELNLSTGMNTREEGDPTGRRRVMRLEGDGETEREGETEGESEGSCDEIVKLDERSTFNGKRQNQYLSGQVCWSPSPPAPTYASTPLASKNTGSSDSCILSTNQNLTSPLQVTDLSRQVDGGVLTVPSSQMGACTGKKSPSPNNLIHTSGIVCLDSGNSDSIRTTPDDSSSLATFSLNDINGAPDSQAKLAGLPLTYLVSANQHNPYTSSDSVPHLVSGCLLHSTGEPANQQIAKFSTDLSHPHFISSHTNCKYDALPSIQPLPSINVVSEKFASVQSCGSLEHTTIRDGNDDCENGLLLGFASPSSAALGVPNNPVSATAMNFVHSLYSSAPDYIQSSGDGVPLVRNHFGRLEFKSMWGNGDIDLANTPMATGPITQNLAREADYGETGARSYSGEGSTEEEAHLHISPSRHSDHSRELQTQHMMPSGQQHQQAQQQQIPMTNSLLDKPNDLGEAGTPRPNYSEEDLAGARNAMLLSGQTAGIVDVRPQTNPIYYAPFACQHEMDMKPELKSSLTGRFNIFEGA
ncbi:unnamed protein product [Protopolystoma xenopodis]|uniref:Uncharacterized protein n=1 Tax=Protopolystoma xenopodis TaxID=117903 RepID=A0A3S5CD36_9PLAT|nr:unnamed protein product [Protopolystoma xenopodis]